MKQNYRNNLLDKTFEGHLKLNQEFQQWMKQHSNRSGTILIQFGRAWFRGASVGNAVNCFQSHDNTLSIHILFLESANPSHEINISETYASLMLENMNCHCSNHRTN